MNGKIKLGSWKMNLKKFKLIGLDTNIFSYHFHNHPQFVKFTNIIFNYLNQDQLKGITSVITLTELLSVNVNLAKIKILQQAFQTTPNLTVLDVAQEIALEAAKIRRKYGFRTPDAIQLATAKLSRAKAYITNDQRLKSYPGLKIILLSEISI